MWLITAAAVIGFDLAASTISRLSGLAYSDFVIGSWLVYVCVGVLASRQQISSVAAGAIAGSADASIGWWLSSLIEPVTKPRLQAISPARWLFIAFVVTGSAILFAALGAYLDSRLFRRLWPRPSQTPTSR